MARKQAPEEEPGPGLRLPEPCANCAPNGGNWSRSIQHHEHAGSARPYDMAGRCSCARGQRLASMDHERAEGRVPAGSKIDPEETERRERQKWGRWKREFLEEQAAQRRRLEGL